MKEIEDSSDTRNRPDPTHIQSTPPNSKYTWNILHDEPHVGLRIVSTFKKLDTIWCIFSDHNWTKLEITKRRKTAKFTNLWK